MTNEIARKIAIKDFYGKGEHIYEDQMGFDDRMTPSLRYGDTLLIFALTQGNYPPLIYYFITTFLPLIMLIPLRGLSKRWPLRL